MTQLVATVCQLPDDPTARDEAWGALEGHLTEHGSQLLVLPEMPFHPWLHWRRALDEDDWAAAIAAHEAWWDRVGALGMPVVTSRPVRKGDRRHNEGVVVTTDGPRATHRKRHLPDEPGYWEASWYQPGDGALGLAETAAGSVGVAICTELWFFDIARRLGEAGAQIIACPRATEAATVDRWLVAARAAAIVGGAYCLSSNRIGTDGEGRPFGGAGWIVDPDGEVLGVTTPERPSLTLPLDLERAHRARSTYPRYVD